MNKIDLVKKGLIPKYITAEQAAEIQRLRTIDDIKNMIRLKNIKSKKLDTGERVVDTLDLLRDNKRCDCWFSQDQRERRVRYLKRLMKSDAV